MPVLTQRLDVALSTGDCAVAPGAMDAEASVMALVTVRISHLHHEPLIRKMLFARLAHKTVRMEAFANGIHTVLKGEICCNQ